MPTQTSRGCCQGYENTLERNWNGNVEFNGTPIVPESIEELCRVVRDSPPPIRVVGRGHSFTPLAECSGGILLSLACLNNVLDFTPPSAGNVMGSITIQGGTTYTEVAQFLMGKRGALANLPSCPQFTVAGAIATATHGSGVNLPNLSAQVSMLEFVQGDGSLVRYSRDDDDAESRDILVGCRVHLGCLGVVSQLTLDVVPYYEVETFRYDDVPLENMLEQLPQFWKSCDSLSVWTSGFGRGHGTGFCWIAFRHFLEHTERGMCRDSVVFIERGTLCERSINRYCAAADDPIDFTPTGKGPWYDALTLTLRNGEETTMTTVDLQAEFFVPLEHAQEAIRAVWKASSEWTFSSPWGYSGGEPPTKGLVDAMEFRQIQGGDGAWLSPHPVDSLGIHISFNGDPTYRANIYETYVPALEKVLEPFQARAHWGKLAPRTFVHSRVEELYGEKLQRFRELCRLHDPTGKFCNTHVRRMIFGLVTSAPCCVT